MKQIKKEKIFNKLNIYGVNIPNQWDVFYATVKIINNTLENVIIPIQNETGKQTNKA
jgi:hypothetical protein